jgi:predicted O-methyltransferase YrrM
MMDLNTHRPPAVLQAIEAASSAEMPDFTISSARLTGALLRTLAASKPGGTLLELGTGVGVGTSWLLDGMSQNASLITIDKEGPRQDLARRFLGHDPRVTFHCGNTAEFILSSAPQRFDLVFADTPPGKYLLLDELLRTLKLGGLYIVDDILPSPKWEEGQLERATNLVIALEQRPDLQVTKLHWDVGVVIATKRA